MHVTYALSEEDFVRAGMLMLRRRTGGIRTAAVIGVVVVLYTLITFLTAPRGDEFVWSQQIVKIFPVVIFGMFLVIFRFSSREALRKQFRKMPILAETRTLQADFSGLHFRSESTNADQIWSVYEAFCEDKDSFLLIQQGSQLFLPLPKRDLTQLQVEEVRSVLDTYLDRR